LEKDIQRLFERSMDVLLGVRFLATEYSTGKKHQGRVDSLGVDENGVPVIIEYKLHQNENVTSQALYYLDWLLDHKAEFEALARPALKPNEEVDWSEPRVLCIAEDFTKFDVYAVEQMGRNIELIRYRTYRDLLVLELVNQPSESPRRSRRESHPPAERPTSPITEILSERIAALGDDVRSKQLKLYVAYQRLKNFACVVSQKGQVLVYLRLSPDAVAMEDGFSRDVRTVGHWGTGDVELRLVTIEDVDKAMPLIRRSYEGS
jgi:predicted transport protein